VHKRQNANTVQYFRKVNIIACVITTSYYYYTFSDQKPNTWSFPHR